jgi:2-polyprenyl-3-methyl-5-hydroxy-6-metoxy-1,4-benzoquinol methylase
VLPLSKRADHLHECMDDPFCDEQKLFNTYTQFGPLNRLVSRWRFLYRTFIRPELAAPHRLRTLLDIGFGGGDLPVTLLRYAREDGFNLLVTAIDPDGRAVRFARARNRPAGPEFLQATARDLRARGASFDFVISNNLLHHLTACEIDPLLDDAAALCRRLVLFNDLERSAAAYAAFAILAGPWLRRSFAIRDGLLSLRRSYRPAELRSLAPPGWAVHRLFPYRLLAIYRKQPCDSPRGGCVETIRRRCRR